jgi:hypothetical protein
MASRPTIAAFLSATVTAADHTTGSYAASEPGGDGQAADHMMWATCVQRLCGFSLSALPTAASSRGGHDPPQPPTIPLSLWSRLGHHGRAL